MSGGPVFRYHSYSSLASALVLREPRLVGVLIERHNVEKSIVLVATNIKYAVQMMDAVAHESSA